MTDHTAIVQPTRYEVSIFPETSEHRRHFTITVEWRGDDRWAVLNSPYCLGTDGVWQYEPRPSSREDEWLATHRFTLDTALDMAKRAAPDVTVNGYRAADIAKETQP